MVANLDRRTSHLDIIAVKVVGLVTRRPADHAGRFGIIDEMSAGDPKDPPRYRLNELAPDKFETLVFRLAWAEDHHVVRLRAPDGGVDTLLPDPERDAKAIRGWQAKRHTGAIDVADCQRSLDRAIDVWAPEAVTFAFPHDLTAREHAVFMREVAGRHPNLAVDYWGEASILARLDTPEGRRIAAATFHEQDAVALAERMLRAGSPLRTGFDYVEAETAIVEGLANADPDYDWVIVKGTADSAGGTPLTDGAIVRLSLTNDDVVVHADLVARHSSPERRVGAIVKLDDSPEGCQARRWLDSLMTTGGRLTLNEGVSLHLSELPAPFGDLFDPEGTTGELVIRATSRPVPYYARARPANRTL